MAIRAGSRESKRSEQFSAPADHKLGSASQFLHTGLFILAHDAMHHSLAPTHPLINQRIGRLSLALCRSPLRDLQNQSPATPPDA